MKRPLPWKRGFLKSILARFAAFRAVHGVVGLGFSGDSLSMLHLIPAPHGHPSVTAAQTVTAADNAARSRALEEWVRSRGLAGAATVLTLESGAYGLFQVERPAVEGEELRAAVRWRIKDFISYPPDQAVVDVFDVPAGRQGRAATVFVAAAKREVLAERIAFIEKAGLDLRRIDITELALRNIALASLEGSETATLLYFQQHTGMIVICRDGEFYIARSLDFGTEALKASRMSAASGLSTPEICDRIALEVQRTMDYYDSHFGQAPVKRLLLVGEDEVLNEAATLVAAILGIAAEAKAWPDLVEFEGEHGSLGGLGPMVLGGALGPV